MDTHYRFFLLNDDDLFAFAGLAFRSGACGGFGLARLMGRLCLGFRLGRGLGGLGPLMLLYQCHARLLVYFLSHVSLRSLTLPDRRRIRS
jgi:hypothetical protein